MKTLINLKLIFSHHVFCMQRKSESTKAKKKIFFIKKLFFKSDFTVSIKISQTDLL